jgi:hypothetical protein
MSAYRTRRASLSVLVACSMLLGLAGCSGTSTARRSTSSTSSSSGPTATTLLAKIPTLPSPTAGTASATGQYLSTAPGRTVVAFTALVNRLVTSPSISGCTVSVKDLVSLGTFDSLTRALAEVPDQIASELLSDDLSELGQALASCRTGRAPDTTLLRAVNAAVADRLKSERSKP